LQQVESNKKDARVIEDKGTGVTYNEPDVTDEEYEEEYSPENSEKGAVKGEGIVQEEYHLTTIRSPVKPPVKEEEEGKYNYPPPPPFPKPLRPPPEERPFNEWQEDPLESVLEELANCNSLRDIIRVHGKIDGRTPFHFPHFFIVGWPHSGAQKIISELNRLSEFDGTAKLNGSSWFNKCQTEHGPDVTAEGCNASSEKDYIQNFLNAKTAAKSALEMITVDTSTDYLQAGGPLARRLYRYFPWMKVVFVIRDPITRLVAQVRGSDIREEPEGAYHMTNSWMKNRF